MDIEKPYLLRPVLIKHEISLQTESNDDYPLKIKKELMCRVCLKDGNISIFDNEKNEIVDSLQTFGGIEICVEDAYPKHLCQHCFDILQQAILFRNMAQKSDKILREPVTDFKCNEVKKEDLNTNERNDQVFDSEEKSKNVKKSKGKAQKRVYKEWQNCKRCDLHFDKWQKYKEHVATEEHKNKKTMCQYCQIEIKCVYLNSHIQTKHRQALVKDSNCDLVKMKCSNTLIKSAHIKDTNCNVEKIEYSITEELVKDSNINIDQNEFYNDNDSLVSQSEDEYEDEKTKEKSKNNSIKGWQHCKRCEVHFDNWQQYKEHVMSEDHKNKITKCQYCQLEIKGIYLSQHMHMKHGDLYICEVCGKKLSPRNRFRHFKYEHSNYFPFKCNKCPYRGNCKQGFNTHLQTHLKEKPFKCTQCSDKSFVNKSNLNHHILTNHIKERKFKCDSCERSFYFQRELDRHMKADHAGIKDHICDICNKAFGYRSQMMKHQRKVHKRTKLRSGRLPLYLLKKLDENEKD